MAANSYEAYEAMKKKYNLKAGVYDDALAKSNPDAGIGILNYQLSYNEDLYYITYDAFASNRIPDIYVTVKGAKAP